MIQNILLQLCTDPLLHEDCQIKVKFLGDRGFKKFLDDDEFGKLTEGDMNTQLLVVFNEKEHDSGIVQCLQAFLLSFQIDYFRHLYTLQTCGFFDCILFYTLTDRSIIRKLHY